VLNKHDPKSSAQPWAMSVEEAARFLGVGRTSVYAAIADGRLKARKLGSRTLVLTDDAKSFLESLPCTGASQEVR
jgi:excisionase family DNA binding protein